MSLEVSISARAELDRTLQYLWYLENADEQIAERFLLAVNETIQTVAGKPDLGRPSHFTAPELVCIRSIQIKKPFRNHLLFYWEGSSLRVERIIHGARDIPRRMVENPGEP